MIYNMLQWSGSLIIKIWNAKFIKIESDIYKSIHIEFKYVFNSLHQTTAITSKYIGILCV